MGKKQEEGSKKEERKKRAEWSLVLLCWVEE